MNRRLVHHLSSWRVFGVSVACALALGASPASAVTIDFESLMHADSTETAHGPSYSEDGFTLSADISFNTYGTSHPNFTGSTALFNVISGGVTELALTGGGSFSLSSIDLAELIGDFSGSVTFTGDLSGGGTVINSFTLDGVAFGAETFTFSSGSSGFGSVTKVSWSQDSPFHQFDNIVASATSSVPEPASLGLLGLGLAGLAWARRRKHS